MSYKSVFTLIVVFSAFSLKAQTDASGKLNQDSFVKIGIGSNVGITTRNSPYNYALGIDLNAIHKITDELSLSASAGYRRLLTKDTSPMPDVDFISTFIGTRIYPLEYIYLDGQVGLGFLIPARYRTAFIYSLCLGMNISPKVELSVRYEGYHIGLYTLATEPVNGQFAARFVYLFKL